MTDRTHAAASPPAAQLSFGALRHAGYVDLVGVLLLAAESLERVGFGLVIHPVIIRVVVLRQWKEAPVERVAVGVTTRSPVLA